MLGAVLGASPTPERYAHKAILSLRRHGHEVIPVHPIHKDIDGLKTASSLDDITRSIDTLTVYVGPKNVHGLIPSIVKAHPKRVILNPGAESAELEAALAEAGIPCLHACTLVMLSTGQF